MAGVMKLPAQIAERFVQFKPLNTFAIGSQALP